MFANLVLILASQN